ncbi:hypothetical protein HNY73_009657 [Argiope bruennichi]|uniref:Uncharacterized protein n=1 Tax=Argiope bruennichi TaxID=94029 RepID=A0A8T0FGX5_ARGBR|nr:hypothetical protein HNY73_009657 [Argiope bruennichi]
MARAHRSRKKKRSIKLKSALKQQPKGNKKQRIHKVKHVRFPTPPYTNLQKRLSRYCLSELFDVYERFVHLELLDDDSTGKKLSLHQVFDLLFTYYEEWFSNFLHVLDKRRRKK